MAGKEVANIIKLQIPGGKASPAPPVGPALGASGVNIMEFVKQFNDRRAQMGGTIIPVIITVYKDKSFEFITKEPPMAVLIKQAAKIEKGNLFTRKGSLGSQLVAIQNLTNSAPPAPQRFPVLFGSHLVARPRKVTRQSAFLYKAGLPYSAAPHKRQEGPVLSDGAFLRWKRAIRCNNGVMLTRRWQWSRSWRCHPRSG